MRRLAIPTLILLALCGAIAASAIAQNATSELEGKLDELEQNVEQQGSLQSTIDAQNAQINDLIARESELRREVSAVQAELDERQAQLEQANRELNAEKEHLNQIRDRLQRAIAALEDLLVGIYKNGTTDTLSVILESASFDDLLAEAEYLERMQDYDEAVVERVSALRAEIQASVERLEEVQDRIEEARDQIAVRRADLAEAESELEAEHSRLVAARAERQASLEVLQARESTLEEDLGTSIPGPGERARLVGQTAIPPAGAPLVVKAVIQAANEISDKPYIWGGGHGSFTDDGYDCSGAVSYALHGGGLLSSPLDSGGFTAWGSPGGGNWITVYANYGHVYMVVAGLRFDTGGTGGGNGPRWSTVMRETSGYTARHPSGF